VKVGFNPIPVSRAALEIQIDRLRSRRPSLRRSTALPDVSDRCRVGIARVRCGLEFMGLPRASRHAAAHHRHSQQRTCARRSQPRRSSSGLLQEGAEPMPTTPEEHGGRHRSRGDQMVDAHPLRRLQGGVGIGPTMRPCCTVGSWRPRGAPERIDLKMDAVVEAPSANSLAA